MGKLSKPACFCYQVEFVHVRFSCEYRRRHEGALITVPVNALSALLMRIAIVETARIRKVAFSGYIQDKAAVQIANFSVPTCLQSRTSYPSNRRRSARKSSMAGSGSFPLRDDIRRLSSRSVISGHTSFSNNRPSGLHRTRYQKHL